MKQMLFFCALTVFFAQSAMAQFGNLLGKAAERAAQRKAEQAIEKKVEDAIDKALEGKNNDKQQQNTKIKTEAGKTIIDTDDAEITVEENNSIPTNITPSKFIGSYTMTMTQTEKGVMQGEPLVSNIYFDAYQIATEMQDDSEKMHTIFDRRDQTITSLNTSKKGEKTGVKMKKPKTTVKMKNASPTNQQMQRTTETKTIHGHTCVKYTFSDEKNNGESWVAENIEFDPLQLAESSKMAFPNQPTPKGMALEVTMRSKDPQKKEVITINISNLKIGSVDKSKFSTAGYKIEDMSKMPIGMPGMFGNEK